MRTVVVHQTKTLQTLYESAAPKPVWKITTVPTQISKYISSISNPDIYQTIHTCNDPSHNPPQRLKSNHIPKVLAERRGPETHLPLKIYLPSSSQAWPHLISSLDPINIIKNKYVARLTEYLNAVLCVCK